MQPWHLFRARLCGMCLVCQFLDTRPLVRPAVIPLLIAAGQLVEMPGWLAENPSLTLSLKNYVWVSNAMITQVPCLLQFPCRSFSIHSSISRFWSCAFASAFAAGVSAGLNSAKLACDDSGVERHPVCFPLCNSRSRSSCQGQVLRAENLSRQAASGHGLLVPRCLGSSDVSCPFSDLAHRPNTGCQYGWLFLFWQIWVQVWPA